MDPEAKDRQSPSDPAGPLSAEIRIRGELARGITEGTRARSETGNMEIRGHREYQVFSSNAGTGDARVRRACWSEEREIGRNRILGHTGG